MSHRDEKSEPQHRTRYGKLKWYHCVLQTYTHVHTHYTRLVLPTKVQKEKRERRKMCYGRISIQHSMLINLILWYFSYDCYCYYWFCCNFQQIHLKRRKVCVEFVIMSNASLLVLCAFRLWLIRCDSLGFFFSIQLFGPESSFVLCYIHSYNHFEQ